MSDPECYPTVDALPVDSIIVEEWKIFEMRCQMVYRGNWAPVMEWKHNASSVITSRHDVNVTDVYTSCVYTSLVNASRKVSGNSYTCRTYFTESERPQNTNATNKPEYRFTWVSQKLVVMCKLLSSG